LGTIVLHWRTVNDYVAARARRRSPDLAASALKQLSWLRSPDLAIAWAIETCDADASQQPGHPMQTREPKLALVLGERYSLGQSIQLAAQ
jgi:hypothetical protein